MALTRARGDDFQSLLCVAFDNALMSARRQAAPHHLGRGRKTEQL